MYCIEREKYGWEMAEVLEMGMTINANGQVLAIYYIRYTCYTLYTKYWMLYAVYCMLNTKYCILFAVYCNCILYAVYCNCILYAVYCNCILYTMLICTVHELCTLYILYVSLIRGARREVNDLLVTGIQK